jgi:ABC-type glycerol-3-phosphate transport system substrate-binding protein
MRQTKNRLTRSLGLFMAIALVAAACGSDDDVSADTTAAPTTTEASTATTAATTTTAAAATTTAAPLEGVKLISDRCPIPAPAESVTIDLLGWEFPITQAYADELSECETDNVTINIQFLESNAANEQIALDLATGSPAFEIYQTTNSRVGEYRDGLLDLTPYIEKYWDEFDLGDIADTYWQGGTVDGKMLGVPSTSNTLHFFYNTEILAENGITPPDNFDEVIAACAVLKDAGFDDAFNMNISAAWSWEYEYNSVIKSIGGKVINEDNTPGWDTPEGLEAVNAILAINDACMTDAGRAWGIDDAEAALRAGELPMATIWASRAAQMDDEENSLVVGIIDFGPALYTNADSLRTGPGFVDYYSIPAGGSVDPEFVFLTIMAAIDLESQNAAAAHAPVTRASASNLSAPRNGAASAQSVAEGVGTRSKSGALSIANSILGAALLEITSSGADPATALADSAAAYIVEATTQGFIE